MLSYSWLRKTFPTEEHIWPSEHPKSRFLPRTPVGGLEVEQRKFQLKEKLIVDSAGAHYLTYSLNLSDRGRIYRRTVIFLKTTSMKEKGWTLV